MVVVKTKIVSKKLTNLDNSRKSRSIDIAATTIDTDRVSTKQICKLLVWSLSDKEIVAIGFDDRQQICWNASNIKPDNILPFRVRRMTLEKLISDLEKHQPPPHTIMTNNGAAVLSIMGEKAVSNSKVLPIHQYTLIEAITELKALTAAVTASKGATPSKNHMLSYKECLELDPSMTHKEYRAYQRT